MSEQPIKLTDEVMGWIDIHDDLGEGPEPPCTLADLRAAIRALRDRAKAVVESEHDDYGNGWLVNHVVDGDALRALEEVLP